MSKLGGRLTRNARSDAPTCLVSSLWFSCGRAVSTGEAAKNSSPFRRFPKQVVMSFCVAVAALRDIQTCFVSRRKSFCDFCGAVTILLRRFRTMSCSFVGKRSTLETSIVIVRGRVSTSDHCVLYTPRSALYTPHSTLHTSPFTHYTPLVTFHTLHSTLHTLDSTLHTLHYRLCQTPHSTLYTPHSTLYTLHSTLYTVHFTLLTPHFTLYTPHSTLHTSHFTLHTLHCTLHTPPLQWETSS